MRNKDQTISFCTIGCRTNQYETSVFRNMFSRNGFRIVSSEAPANIAVINTCTVTENSDTDTRRCIRRLIHLNPTVAIALVGCQAQLQADILKDLPNVRWIIGNKNKFDLIKTIQNTERTAPYIDAAICTASKPFRMEYYAIDTSHTRANLKIQDGCDNFCSYCEVPYARGAARSREFVDIINEANALVQNGHKEIVITGINTGSYQFNNKTLLDVIMELEKIPQLRRIRISSIEPTEILNDVIHYMAGETKLCRYLHVPIQHGHNEILKAMGRTYRSEQLCAIIQSAYQTVNDICIGADVIVGFPGEKEAHFKEMYDLLKVLPVQYFHVFRFSKRRNAKAKDFIDQVPSDMSQKRSAKLRILGVRKRDQFHRQMIGKVVPVLFEQKKNGYWCGLTDNFLNVKVFSKNNLRNTIRRVQLMTIEGRFLIGKLFSNKN